jgi:hypothetical protein
MTIVAVIRGKFEWDEFKEGLFGVVALPVVVFSVWAVASFWMLFQGNSVGDYIAGTAVGGMHWFIFLPGMVLAGLILLPIFLILNFFDKDKD